MRFGFNIDKFEPLEAVKYGILLEKSGFDSIWLADHLIDLGGGGIVDPWTVGAAVAVQTKRILIFSAVTDAQRCHPAKTAHIVANLDALSRGRAVLGIGAGEAMNIKPFGIEWEKPDNRATRVREAVQVIKRLWTSSPESPVYYEGRFYRLRGAYLDQHPHKKPHPPIYIGAFASERMLHVAGEVGDGWIGWINTPETFKERAEKIRMFAEAAGRRLEHINLATMLHVALLDDEEALKMAIERGKRSLLKERLTLRSLGYRPPPFPHYQNILISQKSEEELKRLASQIPDDFVHEVMAIGDEEEWVKKVEALARVGARHIGIIDMFSPQLSKKTIKRFGKVISYFAEDQGDKSES